MFDFEIQRFTRRCAKTGRELAAGEAFYSVLAPQGAEVARLDYAADAWEGPPENALGWWKSHVPDPAAKHLQWAPNDVLAHYFDELSRSGDRADFFYVLALLLIRRKILRLVETETADEQEPRRTAGGQTAAQTREFLIVSCARNETEYRVPVVPPTPERAEEIERELDQILFAGGK